MLAIYVNEVLLARAGRQSARRGDRGGGRRPPFRHGLLLPLGIEHVSITPSAAAQGIAVGLLVSLFFALVPLLEMRRVKPLLLLRADTAGAARRGDALSRLVTVGTGAALVLVAVWQSGSLRAGLFVSAGLAARHAAAGRRQPVAVAG